MNSNQSESLLSTVQELRVHLTLFPTAHAEFENIQRYWIPRQLFPPEETVLRQALSVLINAGELVLIERGGSHYYQAKAPLDDLSAINMSDKSAA